MSNHPGNATRSTINILIPIITGLLGVFADDLVQRLVPGPFTPENLPFAAAAISIVLFVFAMGISITLSTADRRDVFNKLATIDRSLSRIGEAVGPLVRVLPYKEASNLLMERIQAAECEVLVLSNYNRFDWDSGKPKEVDQIRANNNSERAKNYKKTQSKLRQMREREDFRFTKIIQIPDVQRLEEALCHDPVYAADCQFIIESGRHAPERVSLRVAEVIFQNTFVIVDRSFLYLEFDVHDHVDGLNVAPFVMIVEDSENKIVTNLRTLFQRIEAVSKLQKNVTVATPTDKDVAAS